MTSKNVSKPASAPATSWWSREGAENGSGQYGQGPWIPPPPPGFSQWAPDGNIQYFHQPIMSSGYSYQMSTVPTTYWPLYNDPIRPGQPDDVVDTDVEALEKSQKTIDQEWINNLLKDKYMSNLKHSKVNSTEKVKISEAQILIRSCLEMQLQLETVCAELERAICSADPETWKSLSETGVQLKAELESNLQRLTNYDFQRKLKFEVARRKKKRLRLKRLNQELQSKKLEMEKQRTLLHEKIDNWLESIRQKHLNMQMEQKLKAEADSILSEVRKKQSEASKLLEIVGAIKKLRELKKKAAEDREGLYSTAESDSRFLNTINKLEPMLTERLMDYKAEEKALQVMVDEGHQETRESVLKRRQREVEEKQMIVYREMMMSLFGLQTVMENDSWPIFPRSAEYDFETLVQVRQSWDVWLTSTEIQDKVSNASRIPIGWVLPAEPSSEIWAKYIQNEQKKYFVKP